MNGNGGILSYDNGAYDVSVQIQKGEGFSMWDYILYMLRIKVNNLICTNNYRNLYLKNSSQVKCLQKFDYTKHFI